MILSHEQCTDNYLINKEVPKGGKKEPIQKLGRPNIPTFAMAPRKPIYNKSGEEIFDLNDPSVFEETAVGMPEKNTKIITLVAQIKHFFCCDDQKHHGCCWIAPHHSTKPGKHFQMDGNLQWSMAKLLVSLLANLYDLGNMRFLGN